MADFPASGVAYHRACISPLLVLTTKLISKLSVSLLPLPKTRRYRYLSASGGPKPIPKNYFLTGIIPTPWLRVEFASPVLRLYSMPSANTPLSIQGISGVPEIVIKSFIAL